MQSPKQVTVHFYYLHFFFNKYSVFEHYICAVFKLSMTIINNKTLFNNSRLLIKLKEFTVNWYSCLMILSDTFQPSRIFNSELSLKTTFKMLWWVPSELTKLGTALLMKGDKVRDFLKGPHGYYYFECHLHGSTSLFAFNSQICLSFYSSI